MRVGYVLKRYPRLSETFIVNEILAHEAAGLEVLIFSLRPPSDTHFQDAIGRVRAPVHYLPSDGIKAAEFWA
ncbi:MAG: colanic acid biosynthesis glycosyltransferase WcaL, partial [bacterium]